MNALDDPDNVMVANGWYIDDVTILGKGMSIVQRYDGDLGEMFGFSVDTGNFNADEFTGWDITVNGAQIHVWSNPSMNDTDGDGLEEGAEYQRGTQNPRVLTKDIYVEVDWMEAKREWSALAQPFVCIDQWGNHVPEIQDAFNNFGWYAGYLKALSFGVSCGNAYLANIEEHDHRMSQEAIEMVKAPFARHGIILHIDNGNMGDGNVIPHDDVTTEAEFVGNWVWDPIRQRTVHDPNGNSIYGQFFSDERIGIFHYAVFGHTADINVDGYTWMFDDALWISDINMYPRTEDQANTLMHELGHQLGLNADFMYSDRSSTPIDDDLYPSCMRYGANPGDKGFIDYSDRSGIITVWEFFDSNGDGVPDSWRQILLNTDDWGQINLFRFAL